MFGVLLIIKMRVLIAILALALSAQAMPQDLVLKETHQVDVKETGPEINAYIDEVINEMKLLIIEQGLEPMTLPDVVKDFVYVGLFGVHYSGNLSVTNGLLHGMTTIHRDGDADMSYSTFYLHVASRITIDRMLMQYDFITTLIGIGPEGQANCPISGTSIDFAYDMHLLSLQSNITTFVITNNGDIQCNFRYVGIFSQLVLETLLNLMIEIWEDTILAILSSTLQQIMQQALDNLGGFTTVAPVVAVTIPAIMPYMP
ncbi:hypothetical protein B566_EDAN010490 [Ephemera danica]|nr:hypothetical protein B566_EDAN010490 [Ephemera danica]